MLPLALATYCNKPLLMEKRGVQSIGNRAQPLLAVTALIVISEAALLEFFKEC
jgi:hypothetical protein